MTSRTCLSIILAAGEGTRMKSAKSEGAAPDRRAADGRHVVRAAQAAGGGDLALVVGHGAEEVRAATVLCAGARKVSSRPNGWEPRMPCSRPARRSRAVMTTCW